MTINEKSAYLKGLMDGLHLDQETAEGKMIAAIVDLLGDVTKKLTAVEDTTIAISDELDEIEEDLDAIEDFIMDEEDDDYYDDDEDDDYFDDDEDDYDYTTYVYKINGKWIGSGGLSVLTSMFYLAQTIGAIAE